MNMALTKDDLQAIGAVVAQAGKKKVRSWRDLDVWAPAGDVYNVGRMLSGSPPATAGPADEIDEIWYSDVTRDSTINGNWLDMLSPFYLSGPIVNFFGRFVGAGDKEVGGMRKEYNDFLGNIGKNIHEQISSDLAYHKFLKEYSSLFGEEDVKKVAETPEKEEKKEKEIYMPHNINYSTSTSSGSAYPIGTQFYVVNFQGAPKGPQHPGRDKIGYDEEEFEIPYNKEEVDKLFPFDKKDPSYG